MGRHVAPLRHIILFPNKPAVGLTPYCCVHNRYGTRTNFTVFGDLPHSRTCHIYHSSGMELMWQILDRRIRLIGKLNVNINERLC